MGKGTRIPFTQSTMRGANRGCVTQEKMEELEQSRIHVPEQVNGNGEIHHLPTHAPFGVIQGTTVAQDEVAEEQIKSCQRTYIVQNVGGSLTEREERHPQIETPDCAQEGGYVYLRKKATKILKTFNEQEAGDNYHGSIFQLFSIVITN